LVIGYWLLVIGYWLLGGETPPLQADCRLPIAPLLPLWTGKPRPYESTVSDGSKPIPSKQTTNNKQQTTNNKQQTTNNKQQTTNNKQQTTRHSSEKTFPLDTDINR